MNLQEIEQEFLTLVQKVSFLTFVPCDDISTADIQTLRYYLEPNPTSSTIQEKTSGSFMEKTGGPKYRLAQECNKPYPFYRPPLISTLSLESYSSLEVAELLFDDFVRTHLMMVNAIGNKRNCINKSVHCLIQLADRISFRSRRGPGTHAFFPYDEENYYGMSGNSKNVFSDKTRITDNLFSYDSYVNLQFFGQNYGLPPLALRNNGKDLMLPYAYTTPLIEANGSFKINAMPFVGTLSPDLACATYMFD